MGFDVALDRTNQEKWRLRARHNFGDIPNDNHFEECELKRLLAQQIDAFCKLQYNRRLGGVII